MRKLSSLEHGKREGRIVTAVRRVLSLAAFLLLSVPGLALGQGFNNKGLPVVPFTVVNNFDTTRPLYIYIKGLVNSSDISLNPGLIADKWYYVTDTNGNIDIIPQILPAGSYSGMLALNLGTGQTKTLQFPKLNAARIYLSFDAPTVVCCNNAEGGSPGEPIGWDTNEPNFNTLFDWAELAWDNGGNAGLGHKTRLGGNLTQVDMFSLPLHLRLVGLSTTGPGSSTQDAGFTASRATIGKAYMALGTPWTDLLTGGIPAAPLRAVSPYHGIALGLFPSNALDSYIKQVANFYVTNTLTVTASCAQDGGIVHTLAGKVSGGALMFTDTATSVVLFGFAKPSTLAVYQNELHPINTTGGPLSELNACLGGVVAAKLGGGFIRTTLLANTNLDACNTTQFYVSNPMQKYAQIFHTFGINNLAYSFGYDDTCSQSSYINVDDPTSMTIFVGGGG